MLVSVLIAHYNNARYLPAAMQSVYAQTYTDWEIVLVDDGSTDEFEHAIAPFTGDSRIKIFRNEQNKGCGYTKRRCAEKAAGAVLAFLDPDDALLPEALEIMVEAHNRLPHCSLIYATHFICDAQLQPSRVASYPRALPDNTPYLLLGDGSIHAFASFKRAAYEKTEGIAPENLKAVDQDLYYKLEEAGSVFFINQPLYYYRIHHGGISTSGNEARATLAHYAIIKKACLRRIAALKTNGDVRSRLALKTYRARYHKIGVFDSFRRRRWPSALYHFAAFSLRGGMGNLKSYIKKLPEEGWALVRKSLVSTYEIKP